MFGQPVFINAFDNTEMGQICQGTTKVHRIQNCTDWKNVQRQMERVKLRLQKHFGLSHRDCPPHIILGLDNGRTR